MRTLLCQALCRRAAQRPDMVFLTGDLGFMALEPLRDVMGERFINAGISEQNMVTVAAALAREGHDVWVYSIAPFLYARAFEQIRNDLCLHRLPVRLLGNGGGYGYGVMGQTHYGLEDCGVLSTLPHLRIVVPAFGADVAPAMADAAAWNGPSWMRLGRDEAPAGHRPPAFAPWRNLVAGPGPVVVAQGPLVGPLWGRLAQLPEDARPNLWVCATLPVSLTPPPPAFAQVLADRQSLLVVEEHVPEGGLGDQLCRWIMERGIAVSRFRHLSAKKGQPAAYGSQRFMRRQDGLDEETILACIADLN